MNASDTEAKLPQTIGNFRVVRHIATGGTSDVFLATPLSPSPGEDKEVVLKMLLPMHRHDPSFERMFVLEATAYKRLEHPSIVKLHEVFASKDQLVMVLEYVEGIPLNRLRALLQSTGAVLDDRACAYLSWCIFSALAAAHAVRDPKTGEAAPVIHRDINPSNVLIPWDGRVKLADFGIAKVTGVPGDTVTGLIKGTFGYMAPEQARGEPISERADVYTASLLLWELLARRKAIQHGALPELEVMRAMAYPQLPSLDVLRPDLPQTLRNAIARGLEVDAAKRELHAERMASILKVFAPPDDGRRSLVDTLERVREAERTLGATANTGSKPAMPAVLPTHGLGPMRPPEASLPRFPLEDTTSEANVEAAAPPKPSPAPPVVKPAAPPAGARSMVASGVVNRVGGAPAAVPRVPPRPTPSSSHMPAAAPAPVAAPAAAAPAGAGATAGPVLPSPEASPAAPPARAQATLAFSDLLLPRSADPVATAPAKVPGPMPVSAGGVALSPQPPPAPGSAPKVPPALGSSPKPPPPPPPSAPKVPPSPGSSPSAVVPPAPPSGAAVVPPAVTVAPVLLGAPGELPATSPTPPPVVDLASMGPVGSGDEGGIVTAKAWPPSPAPIPSDPPPRGSRARVVWGAVAFLLAGGALAGVAYVGLGGGESAGDAPVSAAVPVPTQAASPPSGAATAAVAALATSVAEPSPAIPGASSGEPPAPASSATPPVLSASSAAAAPIASAPEAAGGSSAAPPGASPSAASDDARYGTLVTGSGAGHRIFVDGKTVGHGAGSHRVLCGQRTVKIGSSGKPLSVDVPCGGSVTVP